MNSTDENEGGFTTMEYVLLTLTIVEQLLSFTGTDNPKSILQVILSLFYQTYRWCYRGVYVADNASVETSKTTSSHFSVNLGSRV
jgi:hypothetical protein